MISLVIPEVKPTISLAGTIRYLAYPQITGRWKPLSGGWITAADNPVLAAMIGFTYGNSIIDGKISLRLPTWNATSTSPVSIYPRPHNKNNSNGRNLSKSILNVVPSSLKAHSHAGSTSANGNHSHPSTSAGRLSGGVKGAFWTGGGLYPAAWTPSYVTVGHSGHVHGGGVSSGMVLDAAHTSPEVEPKGFGAVLCIHLG